MENLAGSGVREIVISPGSRNTPLVLAADQCRDLSTHVLLDERVAGFHALGAARASGRPVALLCTSGTAGAHYLPALIEARASGIPLIAITADRPRELHYAGASQTVEQLDFYGPHVLRSFALSAPSEASPNWLAAVAVQAVRAATGSPAGPVHINAPFRKELWSREIVRPDAIHRVEYISAPRQSSRASLTRLTELIQTHPRGVFVCGPDLGPRDPGGEALLHDLCRIARTSGWPILADPLSGVRHGAPPGSPIVSTHDLFLRNAELASSLQPDLIVRMGRTPTSTRLQEWITDQADATHVWMASDGQWADPGHSTDLWIDAPVASLLADLRVGPRDAPERDWAEAWAGAEADTLRLLTDFLATDSDGPISEAVVSAAMTDLLPEGALLHVASGMAIREIDAFGSARDTALQITGNRGANGIDGTVSTALGAAHHGTAAVLLGDLAFIHDLGGVHAAVEADADLLIVVVDNRGGGIFERLPIVESAAFDRYFRTPQKTDILGTCKAWTPHTWQARTRTEFLAALTTSLTLSGVRIIHVPVDLDMDLQRHHALHERIQCAPLKP